MDISINHLISWLIFAIILCLSSSIPANGNSILIDENDGTYRIEDVISEQQCLALCEADRETCRGTIIYQEDISKPDMICRLNNGKGENPEFPSTVPEPFDIKLSLTDLNDYRAENGLKPLRLNGKLTLASKLHAEDMAVRGEASHTGTNGSSFSDRIQLQAYYFSTAAENVASGQQSWPKVFQAWKDSPGHNVNLLRDGVSDFGISMVYDPDTSYGTFWAMLVAAPLAGHIQDAMARGDVETLAKLER